MELLVSRGIPVIMALQDKPDPTNALDYFVILLATALVAAFFLLVTHIKHSVQPQDCHMAGFRDCTGDAPVITAPHRRDKLE
jgi:hypothetical protein